MFIKRKQWNELNEKVEKLETRVKALEQQSVVHSWFFGKVTFADYVRASEKEIYRLKEADKQPKAAD